MNLLLVLWSVHNTLNMFLYAHISKASNLLSMVSAYSVTSLILYSFYSISLLFSFILDEQGTREAISDDESSPFSKGNTATYVFLSFFSPFFYFFLCVSQLITRVIIAGAAEKCLD